MRLQLPGMSCEDRFVMDLACSLGSQPVHIVALSPGRRLDDACTALTTCVRERNGPSLEKMREVGAHPAPTVVDFLCTVAQTLGWISTDPVTVESLILANVERLAWPRVVLLPIAPGACISNVELLLHSAREMAEGTKNLDGPLTFVLLIPAGVEPLANPAVEVWEPLHPWPDPLPFRRGEQSLRNTGFDIYLSQRIYWEAAGQPQFIGLLSEVFRRSSELIMASDADNRIDQAFDTLLASEGPPGAYLAGLFENAFDATGARAVLKTGIVAKANLPLQHLLAAGLIWYPPGSPRAFITPLAARLLSAFPNFGRRSGLSPNGMSAFRRAARHNQLLASWVLQLTTHVEREMTVVCQRDGSLNDKLDQLALRDKLTQEREKMPPTLVYDMRDDLIDYASFGDLQTLVTQTNLARHFPVSASKLNQIRQTRNLSAHLHPVTWQAVRNVLSVIEQICV